MFLAVAPVVCLLGKELQQLHGHSDGWFAWKARQRADEDDGFSLDVAGGLSVAFTSWAGIITGVSAIWM